MSGGRAHNPEFTQLGLTPPHFAAEYREIADLRERDALPEDYCLVALSMR